MSFINFRSHRIQLILTALTTSLFTASFISIYDSYKKRRIRRALDEDVRRSIATQDALTKNSSRGRGNTTLVDAAEVVDGHGNTDGDVDGAVYEEDLIREQLARNYAFFGEEGMAKIRAGRVVIVGCGGVGSWAAVMLARSGVSKIRLVDFDYVTLSSLNRHATAALADVGTPKVKCIEKTLKGICKWIELEACIDIWRKEEGGRLLEGVDWVVDAIDNITTKVDLLHYCHSNSIKVFSSMGAGAKSDPTRIQISDISSTIYDPLARSVRRRLRLLGVSHGIPVVYSTEVSGDVKLLPLPEEEFQKGNVKELNVFDDFRVRILPVIGPLPSIFGLHIATYILCDLADKPIANPLAIKNRRKLYERLHRDLLNRESKLSGQPVNKLPIDEDDVSLIFEDLHLGRSIIPPNAVPTRPTLVRWDPSLPVSIENVVVMEAGEAATHLQECFGFGGEAVKGGEVFVDAKESVDKLGVVETARKRPEEVWGGEVGRVVERRRGEVARLREAVGLV